MISDWFGTHSTAPAANAGLDLEMPGPPQWFGRALTEAVEAGAVERATVERMVDRLKTLADRTGATDGVGGGEPGSVDDPAHRALIREAAAASFVLLQNDDALLPLDRRALGSVALIGTAADTAWIMGGGSAALDPHPPVTPRAGIAAALGDDVTLTFARGPIATNTLATLDDTALAGRLTMDLFDNRELDGDPVLSTTLRTARALWLGEFTDRLDSRRFSARLRGTIRVDEPGEWTFGLSTTASTRVLLDGEVLIDAWDERERGTSFFGFGSKETRATRTLDAGVDHALVIEFSGGNGAVSGLELGAAPPTPDTALADAVAAAAAADVAIVVVGTGPTLDCEGQDRPSMALPGEQDALVAAVAAANPRTVVCVNAGSPVTMDWADAVPTILQCWLPGEEWGNALADVLFGDRAPGGRLPTTFPAQVEDAPAHDSYPGKEGRVDYTDGLLMGYRGYDRAGTEPRYCFGHGLTYTTFDYSELEVDGRRVSVTVSNTGAATARRSCSSTCSESTRPPCGRSGSCAASPRSRSGPAPASRSPSSSTTVPSPNGATAGGSSPTRRGRYTSVARRATCGSAERSRPDRPTMPGPRPRGVRMAVTAYLLIQTEVGKAATVVGAIRAIDGVVTADAATGPYDIIVKTEAADIDALGRMVVSRIQAVDGITRTQTCPVVNL